MSIEFFADHRTACVLTGLLGLAGSLGYLFVLRQPGDASAPGTPVTPTPTPRPRPASFELGQAEHQKAGQAQTVKLAQARPHASPKEVATEVLREVRDADTQAKAKKMEDLGFHHGVKPTPEVAPVPAAPVPAAAETLPADRNQTAELDDILSRIDKVLSENPVMATNTYTGTDTRTDIVKEPAKEAAKDPAKDDNGQQKLF